MTEKQFENKVKKFLESLGVYVAGTPCNKMKAEISGWYFKVWGGGLQQSGIPDLIININGVFIAVELKATNGRLSELQRINTARINKGRGIGIVLYPDGFENFKEIVKGVLNCNFHIAELNRLKCAYSSTKCVTLTEY